MSNIPVSVEGKVKEFIGSGKFTVSKAGEHAGYGVYYVQPKEFSFVGFPVMAIEKNGTARIVTAGTKEGLEFWKAIRDNIE